MCDFFGVVNFAVDINFCVKDGDGRVARVARIFQLVATVYHYDLVRFCFLRPAVADEVCVSDFLILGDVTFLDGEDGSGAFDSSMVWTVFTDTVLKEATKFDSATLFPYFCILDIEESSK